MMTKQECKEVIATINNYLSTKLWMDFELARLSGGEIVLAGRIDDLGGWVIDIHFIQPYYISSMLDFTYDGGEFISLVEGEEFTQMNRQYNVTLGNYLFKFSGENINGNMFIMAKGIRVEIYEK